MVSTKKKVSLSLFCLRCYLQRRLLAIGRMSRIRMWIDTAPYEFFYNDGESHFEFTRKIASKLTRNYRY